MRRFSIFLGLNSMLLLVCCAQNSEPNYEGEWIGILPDNTSFNFQVSLERIDNENYHLVISNEKIVIDKTISRLSGDGYQFNIDDQLFFDLQYANAKSSLEGFIKSGKFYYHVTLNQVADEKYTGMWNAFMFDNGLQSNDIMLYIEYGENGNIAAYPFLGDQRFRGTWTQNFKLDGNLLRFNDGNTGFNFRAKLLGTEIFLELLLVDKVIAETMLTHTENGWEYSSNPTKQPKAYLVPKDLKDGWEVSNLSDANVKLEPLNRLIDSIDAGTIINAHSVLIAKRNSLIYETYFDGFNAHIPHDLRSASKSISSAIIGIAIDEKIIQNVDEKLYDFIPEKYHYTKEPLKSDITIKDLLTMSSGLDVNNLASENYYQDPGRSQSWLKTVMESPMVKQPGTYADYGSANPFLLGICLNERLEGPLEHYMDEKLFAPLGITNYINQADDSREIPYFGGGMLLTPRDLLKFGQLYLDGGKWHGKQIISENWVQESLKKHVKLQDVSDKNAYGYLWWHDSYRVNGKTVDTVEARGAGGQFIFIIPDLETVVVITSGNFRNGKGNQARDIFSKYIIPAISN